ncbi:MAG: hypothetical protein HZB68_04260 [Candidatus Aenigmarchaeota archaeon]|nr:hypothetical protein [Candidatus Aenigmarchaeota archaeon]
MPQNGGTMNVAFCTYRKWAYDIAAELARHRGKWGLTKAVGAIGEEAPIETLAPTGKKIDPKELEILFKDGFFGDIDVLLMYGWSWILPKEMVKEKVCLALHPSPLPKYRGGSPIQNQIINGERKSAVSIFRMTDKLDAGLLFAQEEISFEGHLNEILGRMTSVGTRLSLEILDKIAEGTISPKEQKGEPTIVRRRKPEQSELTKEFLHKADSTKLFNFCRALEDPYPNPFVAVADGIVKISWTRVSAVPDGKAVKADDICALRKRDFRGAVSVLCSDKKYVVIEKAA